MKRTKLVGLLLIFIIWAASAADVYITGTVTQNGGGPLKDVTISLAKVSGITTKTDSEGKFSLGTPVKVIDNKSLKPLNQTASLKGNILTLSPTSVNAPGEITMFSGNGKKLHTINFNSLSHSSTQIILPSLIPGITILRISINNETTILPLVRMGNTVYTKESALSASNSLKFAELLAQTVSDTLIAKKTGFSDKKTAVTSYTLSNVAIVMDSSVIQRNCNATTLKEAGACGDHKLLIGTAISPSRFNNSIASTEFNYVTPENEMKWQTIQGSEGKFDFSAGNSIVNWAQPKGIKIKGHCLVWHNQLPNWVAQSKGRDKVLGIMKKHIETTMGNFGNKLYAWDVVNEAIATDNDNGIGHARLRSSVFSNEIGPDFIEQAFRIAREYADSHNMKEMKLYYNDYSIDADNDKSKFAHTMIKELVDKGVPIDGVGFQMHIGPPNNLTTAEEVRDNMQFYADLGLEVLISEWDINLCGNKITKQQQLQLYHDITKYAVNQPKCVAITFWGYNDNESWLNNFNGSLCNGSSSQSLLFNNNQKKDTYTQVLNALNGK